LQGAGKVLGFGGEGSRAASALGDHLAKRVSKAASEPAERGSPWAVPSLKFINSLRNKYFITQILNKFLYFLSETFDINQLDLSLSRKIEKQKF